MSSLFNLRDFARICWEEIAEEIFFFWYLVLMPDLGYESGLYDFNRRYRRKQWVKPSHLTKPAYNFKVVFLINRTTLWQEFMMHHTIANEENSEQFLYIRPNLKCFSCFDFSFISSIVAKRIPFIGVFSFGKRKKSAWANSDEYGSWGMITLLLLAKTSSRSGDIWGGALSWCKILHWFFSQFWANSFAQTSYNFTVVLLIDRTTLWQAVMMHHAIAIEENCDFTFD